MKTINKHNYEVFFLDFIEGNLSESQIKDLNEFLSENPELKEELESFEDITLKTDTVEYKQKDKLIKQTQSQFFEITQFEYLAVADSEKDITAAEKAELKKELNNNTEKLDEYNVIKKSKLSADKSITYPFKKKLKRNVMPIYLRVGSYAAAAVIALLLVLNQTVLKNDVTNKNGLQLASLDNINKLTAAKKIIETPEIHQNTKQEVINSHNQTNKLTNNKLLAFNDDEPHNKVNSYEELKVSIPDLKHEALVLNSQNAELKSVYSNLEIASGNIQKKENLWQYAEAGVDIWKKVSSSDFEMNNKYKEDGSIEKLNLYASNFKVSRTFNK